MRAGTCNAGNSGRSGRKVGDVSEGSRLECERTCSKTRDDEVAGEAAYREFFSSSLSEVISCRKKWVSRQFIQGSFNFLKLVESAILLQL